MQALEIIECPRDALQGIKTWVPTEQKIRYVQALLKVGFHTLDVGSFVSPKAIPQMRDTAAVLDALDRSESTSSLLTIVANERGAEQACAHNAVDFLGYPFSISENFQMRNTHKTIEESIYVLETINNLCTQKNKKLVVYLSMGFGNPYGDPWSVEILSAWVEKLDRLGVRTLSLSDTVGTASTSLLFEVFSQLMPAFPHLHFGAHLHCKPEHALEKIASAYAGGCRRFDGAIRGYGGCPMAKDELVGNLPTEKILSFCSLKKLDHSINPLHFESAYNVALNTYR